MLHTDVYAMKCTKGQQPSIPLGQLKPISLRQPYNPRYQSLQLCILVLASFNIGHDADDGIGRFVKSHGRGVIWMCWWGKVAQLLLMAIVSV